jgi:hypothetical protein
MADQNGTQPHRDTGVAAPPGAAGSTPRMRPATSRRASQAALAAAVRELRTRRRIVGPGRAGAQTRPAPD